MRTITLIIVHCSANRAGSALRMADIDSYQPDEMVGAHCKNHNRHSIGVCYIGGLSKDGKPADTRTDAQRTSLRKLLEALHRKYPRALIVGHRDLDPQKACPCFNAASEYADLQPH